MTRLMKNSGIQWVGDIPQNKSLIKNKYFIEYVKGKNPQNINEECLGIAYIGASDLDNKSHNYKNYTTDTNLITCNTNDILILWDGARAGLVGTNHKGVVSSTISKLVIDEKYICSKFFYWYLLGFQKYLFECVNGTTIPHMNKKYIDDIFFINWTLEEQQRIAKYLDSKCTKIDDTIAKEKLLIEKLKQYKQSLITETVTKGLNKNVAFKNSGVDWLGDIPQHWNIIKLKYLGSCQNGINKDGKFFGEGFPFVSYSDVYKNIQLPYKVNGLIKSTIIEQENYSVKKGDIFFTRTSETIEEIGFSSVCYETIPNSTFAGFLIRFRPKKNILNLSFSKYYFRSNIHRAFFVKEMNLVTRASLSQELLKRLPVLIPSMEEQEQVAKYLDEKCNAIDNDITQRENLINKLAEYKKSLIYECVTGKKEV